MKECFEVLFPYAFGVVLDSEKKLIAITETAMPLWDDKQLGWSCHTWLLLQFYFPIDETQDEFCLPSWFVKFVFSGHLDIFEPIQSTEWTKRSALIAVTRKNQIHRICPNQPNFVEIHHYRFSSKFLFFWVYLLLAGSISNGYIIRK